MADIIDFRAKAKPYRKQNELNINASELGKIILFSGVRIERDEMPTLETDLTKSVTFLNSKSS